MISTTPTLEANGARDATRLEIQVHFYICLYIYVTNDYLQYGTTMTDINNINNTNIRRNGARDATRLELQVRFYFIFVFIYFTNDQLPHGTTNTISSRYIFIFVFIFILLTIIYSTE